MSNPAGATSTDRLSLRPVAVAPLVVWLELLIETSVSIGSPAHRPPAISPPGTSVWLAA